MTVSNSNLLIKSHQRSKEYDTLIENSNIRKLGPANIQGVLLQVEDFLDINHIYSYKNWFEGTVFEGPGLEKYWVNIKLSYEYETMPDPSAIPRLIHLGVHVKYNEVRETIDEKEYHYWVVSLRIPKKLINLN